MVEVLVETPNTDARRDPKRINVLPGCHLTPGDLDEIRTIIEDFGLEPSFLPDLAGSLDGHIPDEFVPTTIGGIGVDEVATMGQAAWTIAIGAQMRRAAQALEKKAGVPFRLFERLSGLIPNDEFVAFLSEISGTAGAAEISAPARPTGGCDAGRAFSYRRPQACDRRRAGSVVRSVEHAATRWEPR